MRKRGEVEWRAADITEKGMRKRRQGRTTDTFITNTGNTSSKCSYLDKEKRLNSSECPPP